MRNTNALATALAKTFIVGTDIACVLIEAVRERSRLTFQDASAHGAEGRRVWLAKCPSENN
jgi:hypothetical protein